MVALLRKTKLKRKLAHVCFKCVCLYGCMHEARELEAKKEMTLSEKCGRKRERETYRAREPRFENPEESKI